MNTKKLTIYSGVYMDHKRYFDLDFIRITAIIAVVIIHGFAGAVLTKTVGSDGWIIANAIDSFARWAVPVFIMISGALLIRPQTTFDGKTFLKKRFSRIVIPLLAWPVIYTLWYAYLNSKQPEWGRLFIDLLSGTNAAPHLYFLFIIAGLYLITPLVNVVRNATSSRQFLIISLATTLATSIWYTLEAYLPGHGISLNILTQFLPYIGYYLLGSALKDFSPPRTHISVGLFVLAGVAMIVATHLLSLAHGISAGLFFYSYSSIITITMSLFAFFALKGIFKLIESSIPKNRNQLFYKILTRMSNATFGVYLIHMIVMSFLIAHIPLDAMGIKGSFVFTSLTVMVSYALSSILIRIPYVRRLLI